MGFRFVGYRLPPSKKFDTIEVTKKRPYGLWMTVGFEFVACD